MSISVLVTDADLTPIGQPITNPISVKASVRSQKPASVVVQLPALQRYRDLLVPGNRLMLLRDGASEVFGPMEYQINYKWSADGANQDAEPGLLTIGSTDDLTWLAMRLVYPDPSLAAGAQPSGTPDYVASGNVETLLRALVDTQAGEGALAARRVPHLKLGIANSPLAGGSIAVHARFDLLSDTLRAAAQAGGVTYRIVLSGSDLLFEVREPVDRTATVRFSRGLKNLRSIDYQGQAPNGTVAIVGGDGTGDARTIVEREDSAATALYGRRELPFVSGPNTSDATALNQAGDAALAQGGEQATVSVQGIDTPTVRYGRDYGIDDLVTVEIWPGFPIAAQVTGVDISYDAQNGEQVSVQIGTAATADDRYARRLRDVIRRTSNLETRI